MKMMAVNKLVRDTRAVQWSEKISLDPWSHLDLDAWCEANCGGRFAHDGATFYFEDRKDGEIFRSIWC
jgi:hypothetical protein